MEFNTFSYASDYPLGFFYWHQILSVLIQNTNNSTFFTCTLGHVKKSGIVDALNLRRLKFDASTHSCMYVERRARGDKKK